MQFQENCVPGVVFFDLKHLLGQSSTPEESDEGRSRMGGKLAILGAVGAAGLAALGGALMSYKYFFDPDEGAKRRNSAMSVAKNAASSYGLDGIGKASMQKFMETLATGGK